MKFLLCLCLILCFRHVFLEMLSSLNCEHHRTPNNNFFHSRNCFYAQKINRICCRQVSPNKFRIKRDNPSFKFFIQSYPPPSSNNSFLTNPFINSLGNGQQNSFFQNQFAQQFQQNQPGQFNNIFRQNDGNNFLNNLTQSSVFAHQNDLFKQSNNFLQNILTTPKPPSTKVDAEESSYSEYHANTKPTPIKRSVNKSEDVSFNIHKHKNFNLLPSNNTCGTQKLRDRIFGGEEASIGEFPWMGLLEYSFNGRHTGFKCGGILINDRYVLTAAHCIVGRTISAQENLIRVRLGEHDMNTTIDCDGNNNCNNVPLNVEVEEIILHHGYDEVDKNIHNDIALVRLRTNVVYTDFIKPICLPLHGERTSPGKNMTIVGWGSKNEGISNNVKHKASFEYTNDTQCKELWKDAVNIIDNQFCAGGESMTNACRGDSGGPIMSTFPQSGHWYVEGIVSFKKIPCGGEPFPSVYTRVSSYMNWILDNIEA